MGDKERGLYGKYEVRKDGELLDGPSFVLRYDRDCAAWFALSTYADTCANDALATALEEELDLWNIFPRSDRGRRLDRIATLEAQLAEVLASRDRLRALVLAENEIRWFTKARGASASETLGYVPEQYQTVTSPARDAALAALTDADLEPWAEGSAPCAH